MKKVRIITKRTFLDDCPSMKGEMLWWERLFIQSFEPDSIWYCTFTPWRLFAAFCLKNSKYYKARVEPW